MSLELRKRLFLWQRKSETKSGLVFGTRGGTKQGTDPFLQSMVAVLGLVCGMTALTSEADRLR
jgi:hypothetical protein